MLCTSKALIAMYTHSIVVKVNIKMLFWVNVNDNQSWNSHVLFFTSCQIFLVWAILIFVAANCFILFAIKAFLIHGIMYILLTFLIPCLNIKAMMMKDYAHAHSQHSCLNRENEFLKTDIMIYPNLICFYSLKHFEACLFSTKEVAKWTTGKVNSCRIIRN